MAIAYKLDDLGWFEFEQLTQALLKVKLGMGIEAWGGHCDWGRDAFFEGKLKYPSKEETSGPFIFQSKFVENANAAGAKPDSLIINSVKKECKRIRHHVDINRWRELPTVYSLITNAPIVPTLRNHLSVILKKALQNTIIVIHDGNDICQSLREYPHIVRSFPQMLSLRDLNELLREVVDSNIITRSNSAISYAQDRSRVFVPTSAYYEAKTKLNKFSFVVLEGPPEMGKTTIGRIIALSQLLLGWEAIECRNPKDVLQAFRSNRQQAFVADDFFGRTEYEPIRVSEWQSELAHILPMLDHNHWLILTCRAHLLAIAKSNLDIEGQGNRFPFLGEVVVNSAQLTFGEKARMLYRHAKASGLTDGDKSTIRKYSTFIVKNTHFTPERVRRFIDEYLPQISAKPKISDERINERISEALSNPTKQMRVTFRMLPICHRWLLFSLLEADSQSTFSMTPNNLLKNRYETLCPPEHQRPFEEVLKELTEAFIKKSLVNNYIDWIHPSCRDLTIEILAGSPCDRQRFLSNCSEAGLFIASSLAGGSEGNRISPLLSTQHDWELFASRAETIIKKHPHVLNTIWTNYLNISKLDAEHLAIKRLRNVIKDVLIPQAGMRLMNANYNNSELFEVYLDICRNLGINKVFKIDLQWAACLEDANDWAVSEYVIWQDTNTPYNIAKYISIIHEYLPEEISKKNVWSQMSDVIDILLKRCTDESESYCSPPENVDDLNEAADGYQSLFESFTKYSELPFLNDRQKEDLKKCITYLLNEAQSLRDMSPFENDYDKYSEDERPSGEEIDIEQLFLDL
jgi:hypothetical protein